MLTMRPSPPAANSGASARVTSQVPRTFTRITRSQRSRSISSNALPPTLVAIAALLTRPWIWPSRAPTSRANALIDSGSSRSIGVKRACVVAPSSPATARPASSRMSPSTRRAPALAHARAIARPTPRAAPVTTMVRPASIRCGSNRGADRGQVLGRELLLGLLRQHTPHARDADVVLVEHLALVGVGGDVGQHLAVLLEHVPMPLLERGAIEEAPGFPGDAAHLPEPPEEHQAGVLVDRSGVANDAEGSTRPRRRRIGDIEPAIDLRAVEHHVGPIEVDVLLLDAGDMEAVVARLDLHHVLLSPERKREGIGMQVAGMHGIGEIVVDETIAALPAPHAEDAAPGRVGEFGRQFELGRRGLLLAWEIGEDRVIGLDHRVAIDRLAALERAARHRWHAHDRARAVERDAVVAAGDIVGI